MLEVAPILYEDWSVGGRMGAASVRERVVLMLRLMFEENVRLMYCPPLSRV